MLKPSYRSEHRVPRFVFLLLRGTEKCSENGRYNQGKSGRKRSKGANGEENGSIKATSSDCQSLHPFSSSKRGAFLFIDTRATSYHIKATSTHLEKRRWNRRLVLVHLPRTSCCFPCFHRGWEQGFRLRTFAPNKVKMTIKTILI